MSRAERNAGEADPPLTTPPSFTEIDFGETLPTEVGTFGPKSVETDCLQLLIRRSGGPTGPNLRAAFLT